MRIQINKVFREIKDVSKRFVVLYGGAGSGKSVYISQHIIIELLNNKNLKWCIIRKVARTIKESVFAELVARIHELDLADQFQINKSDYSITCKATKSQAIMLGIDDPEKIKSISGINKFWIEECSELDFNDFKQINLRLRGNSSIPKQIFVSFNPVYSQHWLKKYFFDEPKENAYVVKSTYKDNAFLDEAYKRELEELKTVDKYFYDVYCLGNWGNLTGVIYSNWEVIEEFPNEFEEVIYGLDFGFNDPTALIFIGIKDREFYLREMIYKSQLTNSQLVEEMKKLKINGIIYADTAEPARIQELINNGFNVVKANKNVKDGINFVKSHKLYVEKNSINLINELNTYSWRKNNKGEAVDEPVKHWDHLIDSLRYGCFTHFNSGASVPRIGTKAIEYPSEEYKYNQSTQGIINLKTRFRFNQANL